MPGTMSRETAIRILESFCKAPLLGDSSGDSMKNPELKTKVEGGSGCTETSPSTLCPRQGSVGKVGDLEGVWAELTGFSPQHVTRGWDLARGKEVGDEEEGQENRMRMTPPTQVLLLNPPVSRSLGKCPPTSVPEL